MSSSSSSSCSDTQSISTYYNGTKITGPCNVLEVGATSSLTFYLSSVPRGYCWGSDSKISVVYPSTIKLYLDGAYYASGTEKTKAQLTNPNGTLKGFTIEALDTPSASLNDVAITVKGTPIVTGSTSSGAGGHSHAQVSDTLNLTVYRIKVEVKEKPVDGNWSDPEDQGTRTIATSGQTITRPWYHLWSVNENAIRVVVEPQALGNMVRTSTPSTPDSSFSGLIVEDFASGAAPGSTTPKWKKILSTAGYNPTVTAGTIHFNNTGSATTTALTGTKNPTDIVINSISSIIWTPVDGFTNKIKLAVNGDGERCFPEKDAPNGTLHNQINVSVLLAQNVFDNVTSGKVTVHLDWFDPDNPVTSTLIPAPTNNKNGKRDNNGAISNVDYKTLEFVYADNKVRTSKWTITNAYAGDNWLIAAHPNAGVVSKYEFATADAPNNIFKGRTLMYPKPGGSLEKLPSSMQTKILTVWRTLWIELDQMAPPTAGSGSGFDFNTAEKYGGGFPPIGTAADGKWIDGTEYTLLNGEPKNFDVKFPPPKPNISSFPSLFQAACIDVKEATPAIIASWGLTSRPTTPFVRNLPAWTNSAFTDISTLSRDVDINGPTFWCIHRVGAYEANIAGTWDGINIEGLDGWIFAGAAVGTGIFLIFNETIRDIVSTRSDVKRTVLEMQILAVLHEILHLFGFLDYGASGYDALADGEIMKAALNGWVFASPLPPAVLTLSGEQIRKIQARNYPH